MGNVLTFDVDIKSKGDLEFFDYLVGANQTIWKGSFVMIDPSTGLLIVGADTASCIPVGIADERCISTTAGVKECRVASGGAFLLTTGTLTQTVVGTALYIVDSGSVDVIAHTTNDLKVGRVQYWVDATHSWVFIPPNGTP